MTAKRIMEPTRIEATGGSTVMSLEVLKGFGPVKDVAIGCKVHKVKATGTTTVTVAVKHSPDGDTSMAASHSTPISGVTVTSEPVLLTGYTDTDTNGPLLDCLHIEVGVGGGAGEWAVLELFIVLKPT
jgi:hypothetical protein